MYLVDENVFISVVSVNETISITDVKPFDLTCHSCCQNLSLNLFVLSSFRFDLLWSVAGGSVLFWCLSHFWESFMVFIWSLFIMGLDGKDPGYKSPHALNINIFIA